MGVVKMLIPARVFPKVAQIGSCAINDVLRRGTITVESITYGMYGCTVAQNGIEIKGVSGISEILTQFEH